MRLGDSPVEVVEQQLEPHVFLTADQPRVSGSGGCNRLSGGFTLDGGKLKFSRMASTMMACPNGMEQETRFLKALEKTERYRIDGNHLELLDSGGTVLARFEAVEPR